MKTFAILLTTLALSLPAAAQAKDHAQAKHRPSQAERHHDNRSRQPWAHERQRRGGHEQRRGIRRGNDHDRRRGHGNRPFKPGRGHHPPAFGQHRHRLPPRHAPRYGDYRRPISGHHARGIAARHFGLIPSHARYHNGRWYVSGHSRRHGFLHVVLHAFDGVILSYHR